jgi:hypothetical protein
MEEVVMAFSAIPRLRVTFDYWSQEYALRPAGSSTAAGELRGADYRPPRQACPTNDVWFAAKPNRPFK